jgi:hypothetical protein
LGFRQARHPDLPKILGIRRLAWCVERGLAAPKLVLGRKKRLTIQV